MKLGGIKIAVLCYGLVAKEELLFDSSSILSELKSLLCYFSLITCKYVSFWIQEYLGAEIISHFVSHGSSVSEVIKHLITVLRKKDDKISSILLEALIKVCCFRLERYNHSHFITGCSHLIPFSIRPTSGI